MTDWGTHASAQCASRSTVSLLDTQIGIKYTVFHTGLTQLDHTKVGTNMIRHYLSNTCLH